VARSSSWQRPDVSLVLPVFNEEESLPILAEEIRAALGGAVARYEVLWVDDGSTDGSLAALLAIARRDPRSRVIRLARNAGQSAALAAGFRSARGTAVVTLDADLQNDPADIPRLLAALAEPPGWDLVCGVRVRRCDGWLRRLSSRLANAVRNRVTGERIADVGCSLKAFRAETLRRIPSFDGMHRFFPTLVRLEGGSVRELPVEHRPRLHGRSKYGVRNRLFRSLADLLAVRWLERRWIDRRLAVFEAITEAVSADPPRSAAAADPPRSSVRAHSAP